MSKDQITLNTIEEAIEDIRQGKVMLLMMRIVENEGDFLAAAENK
jgi:3,4-dihydroxy 2-butanone 4-phosphate synthase/GTP cyclohydrolase II